MKLVRPLRGLWLRIQVDGFAPTARGVVDGFTPKVWNIYKLAGPLPERTDQVAIDTDLERLDALRSSHPDLASEYYRDQARRATKCFFAILDGKLAGIVWILDAAHPSRVIRLGRDDVELAFLFVEPEFRGRGIARGLIREACRVLPMQGVDGIYSIIEQHNLPSQRAFLACGFQQVGAVRRPLYVGPRYQTGRQR